MNQFHTIAIDRSQNLIVGVMPATDLVTAQQGCRIMSKLGQAATVLITSRALRALATIDAGHAVETSPANFTLLAEGAESLTAEGRRPDLDGADPSPSHGSNSS